MKIVKIFIASQVLLLSPLVFCQQSAAPFSLTIATDQSNSKPAHDLFINIEIKNISNLPFECSRNPISGGLDVAFQYEIRTAEGRAVPRVHATNSFMDKSSHGWPCLLQPGETILTVANIGRAYDIQTPGKYLIQISQYYSATKETVKSNQIEVVVTSQEPPQ